MPHRVVKYHPRLLRRASVEFPPNGSVAGRPRLSQFLEGPCAAARDRFATDLESQHEVEPGYYVTATGLSKFFAPMVFAAVLNEDGEVEMLDFKMDEDYWEQIADDPID